MIKKITFLLGDNYTEINLTIKQKFPHNLLARIKIKG